MTITVKITHEGGPYTAIVTGGQLEDTKQELKPGKTVILSLWETSPPIVISEKPSDGGQ